MASIRDYHRPRSVGEALALLNRSGTPSVVLGGGTSLVPGAGDGPVDVIDLQALPIAGIEMIDEARVRIGAMSRLQDVVDSDAVPSLIRDAARREAPNTIRNAATIGGTIGKADWESGLLAALLVHEARIELIGDAGSMEMALAELLGSPSSLTGHIVVAVAVAASGETARAATGRTPADTPIVAAYVRLHDDRTLLALTGVAATPVLVEPDEVGDLDPPADFRGSAAYRHALAATLANRALESLGVSS